MKRLIILSDLWGSQKASWIKYYEEKLNTKYQIIFYDSCRLGQIDLTTFEENAIHQQFKENGIENAVNNLLEIERQPIDVVIGFSIGGTIIWRAISKGLNVKQFIGISATRLRFENQNIPCDSKLYFGELDQYQPNLKWLQTMSVDYEILKNRHHDLYQNEKIADLITKELMGF